MSGATRVLPVFVVAPPRLLLFDVAGPLEALRKANLEQDELRFDVRYIGPSRNVISSIGLRLEGVEPLPEHVPDGAWIVAPGATDALLTGEEIDRAADAARDAEIVAWLAAAVRPGVRLICMCSGALYGARAGLLDGRPCTTHHAVLDELERLAPKARVHRDRLFVDDGDRLTSAGISTCVDMALHLISQEASPRVALAVARYLVLYLRRAGGDPQLSPWLEHRNHIHPAIHRAQDAITADPSRDWSVEALSRLTFTSPRNLSRLFNAHAGCSVVDYVNRIRVALARELVTESRLDMETVAERSGFASARQMRRAWSRVHAAPPTAARADGSAA
jgi:transcriptional regulator GlxA family with amidase domain